MSNGRGGSSPPSRTFGIPHDPPTNAHKPRTSRGFGVFGQRAERRAERHTRQIGANYDNTRQAARHQYGHLCLSAGSSSPRVRSQARARELAPKVPNVLAGSTAVDSVTCCVRLDILATRVRLQARARVLALKVPNVLAGSTAESPFAMVVSSCISRGRLFVSVDRSAGDFTAKVETSDKASSRVSVDRSVSDFTDRRGCNLWDSKHFRSAPRARGRRSGQEPTNWGLRSRQIQIWRELRTLRLRPELPPHHPRTRGPNR